MSAAPLSSGLGITVPGLSIKGVVCAVPPKVIANEYFHDSLGADAVAEVVKMVGVQSRRWAAEGQTASDLCEAAARTLLAELDWDKDSVDAVIFISQTPDYRLPATACALHGRLQLRKSCAAFDVNLGCSGYAYGLWLAGKLLDGIAVKRVLLLCGDTSSKIIDHADRATAVLFGDAGAATALEYDAAAAASHFIIGSDGAGARNLIIPDGGMRPSGQDDARWANKSPSCLYMDGGEIFSFTLAAVPPLVRDSLAQAGVSHEQVDGFLFHQANMFMLKHLIKKSKIEPERAPINIDRFGNVSSASIPLLMVDALPNLTQKPMRLAMFGFGVGYSWGSAVMEIGPLAVNKLIEA